MHHIEEHASIYSSSIFLNHMRSYISWIFEINGKKMTASDLFWISHLMNTEPPLAAFYSPTLPFNDILISVCNARSGVWLIHRCGLYSDFKNIFAQYWGVRLIHRCGLYTGNYGRLYTSETVLFTYRLSICLSQIRELYPRQIPEIIVQNDWTYVKPVLVQILDCCKDLNLELYLFFFSLIFMFDLEWKSSSLP